MAGVAVSTSGGVRGDDVQRADAVATNSDAACTRDERSMGACADTSTVAPLPDAAWWIACRRCSRSLATSEQLYFVLENERSIHLALRKDLLDDVQARSGRNAAAAAVAAARHTAWKLQSIKGVTPPMRFTKTRTLSAKKRARIPFEINCAVCQHKVAGECQIDERPGIEYLLDSKNCECVVASELQAATPSAAAAVAGKNKPRKWSVVMHKLQRLGLPVLTDVVESVYLSMLRQQVPAGDGTTASVESESDSLRYRALAAHGEMSRDVVQPTVESIRASLSRSCKLSVLRSYQLELVLSALLENTVVYLPTGAGKTLVAVKVIDEMVRRNPTQLTVMFVPTGPLVTQQAAYVRRETDLSVLELSGQHTAALRERLKQLVTDPALDVLVVTPQYFANLVTQRAVAVSDFSVMVFDEAHHATGEHPYRSILQLIVTTCGPQQPRLLALTASPFGESRTVATSQLTLQQLADCFGAQANTPTLRGSELAETLHTKNAQWVVVEQSESEWTIRTHLKAYTEALLARIKCLVGDYAPFIGSSYDLDDLELTQLLSRLRAMQEREQLRAEDSDAELLIRHVRNIGSSFFDLSIHGARHVARALEHHFMTMVSAASPVTKRQYALVYPDYKQHLLSTVITLHRRKPTVTDKDTDTAADTAAPVLGLALDDVSSRVQLVATIVADANFTYESRAIVFVRRRKTAIELAKAMEASPVLRALNPTRFIGHNSYEGMSWEDEQKPTLERFRQGRIRLLVATNVLEEGLDVPECSLVIQFDGIKGVTSLIQSRGRARRANSRFVVFCSPDSVDRQQQIVQREADFFSVAKRAAETIPSKVVVQQLLHDLDARDAGTDAVVPPADSDATPPSNAVPARAASTSTTTAAAVLANIDSDSDGLFSILVGPTFDRDNTLRDHVLSELAAIVTVRCVDEKLGLCTLAPHHGGESICRTYHALCRSLAFWDDVSGARFWITLADPEADAEIAQLYQLIGESDGDESGDALRVCEMQRGLWSETSAFVPLETLLLLPTPDANDYSNSYSSNGSNYKSGRLSLGGTGIKVALERERFIELDLRQLSDNVVCLDASSVAGEVAVYVSLLVPPHVYHKMGRACVDNQHAAQVYRLRIPCDEWRGNEGWSVRLFLMRLGIDVRETHVRVDTNNELVTAASRNTPALPFEVAYALQVFQSRVAYFTNGLLPPEFWDLLAPLDVDVQAKALTTFQPKREVQSCRAPHAATSSSSGSHLVDALQAFIRDEWLVLKGLGADNVPAVYKVVVTPTRIVFRAPEPAPGNRVFRHFGAKHFLYVYFRDENLERLEYGNAQVVRRIRDVLECGITVVNVVNDGSDRSGTTRRFRFLGSSLSQVRNSSCVFTLLDPHVVRRWVGDLDAIQSPAKYLKRMSQAFSSTKPTFCIDHERLAHPVADITHDDFVFTDGCGEISHAGARRVAEALQLRDVPSAFQIRVGGVKGVVVVSDVPDALQDKENCVQLRQSMHKFTSRHNVLEVVACAGRSVAYLTRQSIQILNSLGVHDDVFLAMQDAFLDELSAMVASDSHAFYALKGVLPPDLSWWIEVFLKQLGTGLLADGFLGALVDALYRYHLTNTVLRARIPVQQGRTLMGVADFTNTLRYGEVFVQYTQRVGDSDEYCAVALDAVDVVVHRSPCHHPGDIRVLRCRTDVPAQLQQLRDVIVFPCDGPRPHPDECTGGDLDGDVFTVLWDERLVPPRERVQAPMEFPPAGADKREHVDDASLIAFYVRSIQRDVLGVASNAHLALCDHAADGIFDTSALELARICSLQVDNDQADEHIERVRALAPHTYPDFMRNTEKGSYQSKKVLGVLYRRCSAVLDATRAHIRDRGANVNDAMPADGYEQYVDAARVRYRQYKQRVAALLLASGAESEAELALGLIVAPESLHRAEYFRYGEQLKETFAQLQAAAWREFAADVCDLPASEAPKVASAWYYAAYSDRDDPRRCLSFAWVVIRTLVATAVARTSDRPRKLWTPTRTPTHASIVPNLQMSLLAEVQVRTDELLSDTFDRLVALSALRASLAPHFGAQPFELVLFGSSALLTFEHQSDLDVVVHAPNARGRGDLAKLAPFLEKSFSQVAFKPSLRVPLLSFPFEQWAIELSASRSGPLKTRLFRTYMAQYAFVWPCVYVLVRWGKCAGVVTRRAGDGLNLFSPTGLMWLFLRFCVARNFVRELDWRTVTLTDVLADHSTDATIAFWTAHLTALVSGAEQSAADVLLAFFAFFADRATPLDAFAFTDPFDDTNDTQLNAANAAALRERCYVALHILLLARGDITSLLAQQQHQSSKVTLSRALSKRVSAARDFYARKILVDARVTAGGATALTFARHPNALRPDLLVAEIRGDGDALQRVHDQLQRIEKELGAPHLQRSGQLFHREGSALLLFEGAVSQHDTVGFQEYVGSFHAMHGHAQLHQAHLVCFMNGQAWYEHAATSFSARFVQQMLKLARFEAIQASAGLPPPKADAFIRFGHHYLIHLPRSFHDETIAFASIATLEQEFERGRTARALYESVLVAKQEARRAEGDGENDDDYMDHDNVGSRGGGSNGGSGGGGSDGGSRDYHDDDDHTERRRPHRKPVSLERATSAMSKDKGVTHSFYTEVDGEHRTSIPHFALAICDMTLAARSETYGASIVFEHVEYIVKLTPDLTFRKLKTRPSRWFSTTLKMRQELDDATGAMDVTPDVRFYVSTTEPVPVTHALHERLTAQCRRSPNGRGVLDFVDDATRANVRLSDAMVAAGEPSGVIPTVRHVVAETYESASSGLQMSLMRVTEFTTPSTDTREGFLTVKHKLEVEFVMPALTPARRHDPAFARTFLATGVAFVEYLREHSQLSPAKDGEQQSRRCRDSASVHGDNGDIGEDGSNEDEDGVVPDDAIDEVAAGLRACGWK